MLFVVQSLSHARLLIESQLHSFIHSFILYLLHVCLPGPVLGGGDARMIQAHFPFLFVWGIVTPTGEKKDECKDELYFKI